MPTVEEVATRVLAAVEAGSDDPIGITQVASWISDRYEELLSRVPRMRHKRGLGALNLPAPLNTGTLAATRDSSSIVADGDAQGVLTSAVVGRWLRLQSVWYEITDYTAPTITIATPFTENDISSGGYILRPRFLALAEDARWIGTFVHPRLRRILSNVPWVGLDMDEPSRILIGSGPTVWSETYDGSGTAKRVEVYPYPPQSETLYYVYWSLPKVLALSDTIPLEVDGHVLREGALIDLYRYRSARALNKGQVEIAATWENVSRKQATAWEDYVKRAARADRGVDDITFICSVLGIPTFGSSGDIRTARDEVWARGNRP